MWLLTAVHLYECLSRAEPIDLFWLQYQKKLFNFSVDQLQLIWNLFSFVDPVYDRSTAENHVVQAQGLAYIHVPACKVSCYDLYNQKKTHLTAQQSSKFLYTVHM